ncbi:MAG: serine/threonine-protein kinase [Planctomycetes bacterium]|nr:serine/threonine-protein kinase [Planctomycetota bacterium]
MEAQLQVEEGASIGAVLVVEPGQTKVLGRGPGADLRLDDPSLAARHAAVRLLEGGLQVVDLGAPGGTRLNEAPLPARSPAPAESGDLLRLGEHAVRVTVLGAPPRRRRAEPFPAAEFAHVRRLGAGATGKVYRARWLPRGLDVALKLLREEYGPESVEHARFLRECATVSRLRCPYVVAVYDVRRADGHVFTIMELVEGAALDALLAGGALEVPAALRVAADVAAALEVAARHGVVHRDVKPANVLLDRRAGLSKLCDFGLAKDLEARLRTLTAQGVGLGTLAYLPPEQVAAARGVGPAADVYSLGATLFHALAGRPPWDVTSEEDLAAILERRPPPLRALRPDAPPEVEALVSAMLGRAPAERPTAAAAGAALRACLAARFPGWDPRALFARP